MAVENMQGDPKVSSANEYRKTSAGASQARSRTRPLQNQRTKQGFGTFLSGRVRGILDVVLRFSCCSSGTISPHTWGKHRPQFPPAINHYTPEGPHHVARRRGGPYLGFDGRSAPSPENRTAHR